MSTSGDRTSREQDAVRILLIISAAATPLPGPVSEDPALADAIAVVETQVKLQKLDFWVRNPDYLAATLLDDFEVSGEPYLLELAQEILESEEPEVRRYPMMRFLFGAWEPLDEALSVLRSAGLVVRRKQGTTSRVTQHNFYLTQKGKDVAERVVAAEPVFAYYADRVKLVAALTEGHGGTQLKQRQYLNDEYRNTPIGEQIGSVAGQTRSRLRSLRGGLAGHVSEGS
ncbi:hypothetical protein ACFQO7_31020 [Catellatospora aurea]|uniref:Golgi phosphoprotein 3 GPP34 n=1 Tax=Catellatospora aurea TaxID=1337874 RepID=A0ABW2H3U7_9ACTN